MISIHHNTKNQYRIYGIAHFLQKYGISLNNDAESNINLIYGDFEDMEGFKIQIVENEMQNDISGYLKIENDEEKIPLFEKPIKLDVKGEILVRYFDKNDEYPCVASKDNTIIIGFDIFNEVGHILTGYLEHVWKKGEKEHKRLAKIPIVDYYEKILFDCLLFASRESKIPLNYKPFWPDGKKLAVCLTHDVDRIHKTYQYFTHFVKYLKRGNFYTAFGQIVSIRGDEPYWNFRKIIEIESKLGVKSTFFFLNEESKTCLFTPREWKLYWGRYDIMDAKIVELIRKLDIGRWEIGVHGSYNSYNDIKKMEEEKKILEEILGKKVYGISQHYLNLENPRTWEYHEKLGFVYDSSIGFVTDIGFRWGTCHPFHPFNPANGKLIYVWELPITIMDNACDNQSWNDMVDIISVVERFNGLLLLRWHQEIFDEREFQGRSKIYEKIIEMCKEKNAWITNAYSVVEWLRMRENNKKILKPDNQIFLINEKSNSINKK